MDIDDWRLEASCRGKHQDFWYPPLETDVPEHYYSVAREVCKTCPVWKECLEDSWEEKWGMWSGLTPKERQNAVEDRSMLLRGHGTWLRYRQGCKCRECHSDHTEKLNGVKVHLSKIPSVNEPVGDLSAVRYGLLG